MQSSILKSAARYLLLPFLLLSLIILYRGHNQPGGGFIGGLVAASSYILYTVAYGVEAAEKRLRFRPQSIIAVGLTVAFGSTLLSTWQRLPLMTGLWLHPNLPVIGKQHFGTPQLFDLGVYLTVFGVMMTLVFTLSEESQ